MNDPNQRKSPIDEMIGETMKDDIPPNIEGDLHNQVYKWFRMINDDFEDIPKRIAQMKSGYTKKTVFFFILILVGILFMAFGHNNGFIAIGCYMALSGICGILALSTMCHTQLCFLRTLKEIRLLHEAGHKQGQEGA